MVLKNNRDIYYDVVKGIAILLVVLGHSIQYNIEYYDDNLFFKIIYSFHMPLFFFVSGAVLSIKYRGIFKIPDTPINTFFDSLWKIFFRLLVPFIVWTILIFFIHKKYLTMNLIEWLSLVGRNVDNSLWFLLALFYCLGFFYVTKLVFDSIIKWDNYLYLFLISLIMFLLFKDFIPNVLGIKLFKYYYPYFILRTIWNLKLRKITYSNKMKYILIFLFFFLSYFWIRNEAVFSSRTIESIYRISSTLLGIFVILTLSKFIITNIRLKLVKDFLVFCSMSSLGIYAIHFHFLNTKPYFIAPLIFSLGVIFIIRKTKVFSCFLLGECKKKGRSK